MKLGSLLNDVLYENEERKMKLYYEADIFIQEFKNDEEEKKEDDLETQKDDLEIPKDDDLEIPKDDDLEIPKEESFTSKRSMIVEDIFEVKKSGSFGLTNKEAENILTFDDLLSYLKSKKVIDEIAIEILISIATAGEEKIAKDIIDSGDKFLFSFNYGFDIKDSIGVKVVKNKGVKEITIIGMKDGTPSGSFNKKLFNKTITSIYLKELQ